LNQIIEALFIAEARIKEESEALYGMNIATGTESARKFKE
jgi:hypothetical protein